MLLSTYIYTYIQNGHYEEDNMEEQAAYQAWAKQKEEEWTAKAREAKQREEWAAKLREDNMKASTQASTQARKYWYDDDDVYDDDQEEQTKKMKMKKIRL